MSINKRLTDFLKAETYLIGIKKKRQYFDR